MPVMRKEAEDWRLAVEAFENGEGLLHMSNQILLFPESGNQHTAVETRALDLPNRRLRISWWTTFYAASRLVGLFADDRRTAFSGRH